MEPSLATSLRVIVVVGAGFASSLVAGEGKLPSTVEVKAVLPSGKSPAMAFQSSAHGDSGAASDWSLVTEGVATVPLRTDCATVLFPTARVTSESVTDLREPLQALQSLQQTWWAPPWIVVPQGSTTAVFPFEEAVKITAHVAGVQRGYVAANDSWCRRNRIGPDGKVSCPVRTGHPAVLRLAFPQVAMRVSIPAEQTVHDTNIGEIVLPALTDDSKVHVIVPSEPNRFDRRDTPDTTICLIPNLPHTSWMKCSAVRYSLPDTNGKTYPGETLLQLPAGEYWVCVGSERVLDAVLAAVDGGADLSTWGLPKAVAASGQTVDVKVDADATYQAELTHTGLEFLPGIKEQMMAGEP